MDNIAENSADATIAEYCVRERFGGSVISRGQKHVKEKTVQATVSGLLIADTIP